MSQSTRVLNIGEVFDGTSYVVPIYQRAYAWRDDEILQLVRDIRDARLRMAHEPERPGQYFLGTLVVHRASDTDQALEVVDGQQRLTTLALILSHPKARDVLLQRSGPGDAAPAHSVTFEGRPVSQRDLAEIAMYPEDVYSSHPAREPQDDGLRSGVAAIARAFHDGGQGPSDGSAVSLTHDDVEYLLDHVHLVRADLPPRTDLNHYFEIMNSRGEQLEHHEIVKAHLLGHDDLDPADRNVIATVWDAVSDLSRYVQQGFTTTQRTDLFGKHWDKLDFTDDADLFDRLRPTDGSGDADRRSTLGDLLSRATDGAKEAADEEAGRYGAIIDFPNLLLQALKIHLFARMRATDHDVQFSWSSTDGTIALDDKRLIKQFKTHITSGADARAFTRTLLVVRFLFDNYVIKTDQVHDSTDDDSNWVLRRPSRTTGGQQPRLSPRNTFSEKGGPPDTDDDQEPMGLQRQVVLLESMFQVTDSRRAYKNFLFAILDLLWQQHSHGVIDPHAFIVDMEGLARRRAALLLGQKSTAEVLHVGTSVPQFLFNYLDYLLWRDAAGNSGTSTAPELEETSVKNFQFRYRKSIEHFEPVSPTAHHRESAPPLDTLNNFGNLCVMTVSENSRRNNLVAVAKAAEFRADTESLKFQIMAARAKAEQAWGTAEIIAHGREMEDFLTRSIRG